MTTTETTRDYTVIALEDKMGDLSYYLQPGGADAGVPRRMDSCGFTIFDCWSVAVDRVLADAFQRIRRDYPAPQGLDDAVLYPTAEMAQTAYDTWQAAQQREHDHDQPSDSPPAPSEAFARYSAAFARFSTAELLRCSRST